METNKPILYTAQQFWGAAVAAQRINGHYVKRHSNTTSNYDVMVKCLQENTVTSEDIEQGMKVRDFFQGLMFQFIQGTLQEFMLAAFNASTPENFSLKQREAYLIASLPQTYLREIEKRNSRDLIDSLEEKSQPYSQPGSKLPDNFVVTIVTCTFNNKYGNFSVNALHENYLFFFWSHRAFTPNAKVVIHGKVQQHYHNQTTQISVISAEEIKQE